MGKPVKITTVLVGKREFDSALGKLLRADPLPMSEVPTKKRLRRKARKGR